MNKTRQYKLITKDFSIDAVPWPGFDNQRKKGEEIHVIEMSAYQQLQAEFEAERARSAKLQSKRNDVLYVCKNNEHLMWSAKIIGIILDCDFRDGKQALEAYESAKRGQK